uniref:acetolactate decarboxylase n=1 Tax=Roseivirga sp. TaxID=1964215 RepID=UPI004047731C
MNRYIFFIFIIVLFGCEKTKPSFEVSNYGVLREIMMENKLDTYIELQGYEKTEHFYAIGALKQLTGEFMIIDSQPILSKASNGEVIIQRDYNEGAILAISAVVHEWNKVNFDTPIGDLASLQTSIKALAEAQGLDISKPFPFMLEGNFSEVNWHIINAAEATEQNHEAYKKAGIKGNSIDEKGRMLGFYSENHEGIFTHHGSYLHVHFVNDSITRMGHVDELSITEPIVLSLPKSTKE